MNCNSCIKKVDCVIYNQFKDKLSTEWSLENNFCNKYQGVLVDDSFDDLLDELETAHRVGDELIEEKQSLEESIDDYKDIIKELRKENEELNDYIFLLKVDIERLEDEMRCTE